VHDYASAKSDEVYIKPQDVLVTSVSQDMIDQTTPSPFGPYKGQGWVVFLSSLTSSSPHAICHFAEHPTTKGRLVGGPGFLSLYRYYESPFGPYDELSYSPGWYEYLNICDGPYPKSAKRITKSFVSCNDAQIARIRYDLGIPAERAQFTWNSFPTGEVAVQVTLPNGVQIIDLIMKRTSFPSFTINSVSLISDWLDVAKLSPIVQPLLDGRQVPVLPNIDPHSPLLTCAPLLKAHTTIRGESGIATLVRAATNRDVFPPIEEAGVSRYGFALMDVEMIVNPPEIVLDVVTPGEYSSGSVWRFFTNWFKGFIFVWKK